MGRDFVGPKEKFFLPTGGEWGGMSDTWVGILLALLALGAFLGIAYTTAGSGSSCGA